MMRSTLAISAAVTVVAVAAVASGVVAHSRGALWRLVNEKCVPESLAGTSKTCVAVSQNTHDAVLKDRRGDLQYLLIPTVRVTGIEDPALLGSATPYFDDAWKAKHWVDERHGAALDRRQVAIALNSQWSRSQNQLHLHVSCVRSDLAQKLARLTSVSTAWTALPGGWLGHEYAVRWVAGEDLGTYDPITDVAAKIPGAKDTMGSRGIAVIGAQANGSPGFWILQSEIAPTHLWLGGVEGDVQDHDCKVLNGHH